MQHPPNDPPQHLAYMNVVLQLLPETLREPLEDTIAATADDDTANAWALRGQFDVILDYTLPYLPSQKDAIDEIALEPFTPQQLSTPLQVMDSVMGGMSNGKWLAESNTFAGTTSLANNGGFASLRWRFPTIQNWSYAKGVYLKVQQSKPGHTFRLILKDTLCEQVRGANYKTAFANPSSSAQPIYIPFSAFHQIEQMGRALTGPVLNPSAVTEVGIMAMKPTLVGDFELTIIDDDDDECNGERLIHTCRVATVSQVEEKLSTISYFSINSSISHCVY